jgi:hydroxyethylthiazole kinase-like uncharacterized protein yjeF
MTAPRLALAPLWTAAHARDADVFTIDTVGVPGLVLMEHAGRAVADVVAALPGARAGVDVVCGPGNNGGDGWVCARHLAGRGLPVRVLALRGADGLRGDAALAARAFLQARRSLGGDGPFVDGIDGDVDEAVRAGTAGVVVDALYGTGLSRPLDERSARVVAAVAARRAAGAAVVAVDLPSGLPTDGAAADGAVVQADITVTFAGRKIAHVAEPGFPACGRVLDVDIGVLRPPGRQPSVFVVDDVRLPAPPATAHKGVWGHVGVVAGDPSTAGAALLAARGALRAGAGLVTVLGDVVGVPRPPEVMTRGGASGGLPGADDGALDGIDVVVIGPGLAPATAPAWLPRLTRARARGARVVADAGALGALPTALADVWTPHPGEAARLLGVAAADVQRDRLAAGRALQQRLGGVVVLKGAAPVVASATRVCIVPGGAPALGVGGSGDVLAGVVGAALGGAVGGGDIDDAVVVATWLHQQAGRALRRGCLAGEIADAVAVAVVDASDRNGDGVASVGPERP